MIPSRYWRYLLPVTLGILGLLLLIRVFLIDAMVLVPEHIDVVVLVSLLAVAIIVAIHTLVQISMNYLRMLSIQRARRETLAEHGRFLRRLDHELKNPLTTLRTGLKTLALTELTEQQRQMVKTMETETLRLTQLVSDLRKLAELETQPLNMQPVSLSRLVQNALQIEQERFEAGQRALTYRISGSQASWVADEDLLLLALHNLLDNAYKYTRPGDSVHLEVTAQDELVLQVRDTGLGIPPDALAHIWEELYRAEQMEKIQGSGIGLALVKAIVERHNGAVSIASQPGEGTTVTLRLPPGA